MKIISEKKKLSKFTHNKKDLGFVPTMGGIHIGHISLIKRSVNECKKTVVSIFVNKQQFNKYKYQIFIIWFVQTVNKTNKGTNQWK